MNIDWSEIMDLNELLMTGAYWIIMFLLAGLCMIIFEWVTPYNDREELKKGNIAVGIQFAGKLIGLGIITQATITHNVNLIGAGVWFLIGFVIMILGYYLFEWVTPFRVEEEIKRNNIAVAIVAAAVSIFIGFVVAGSIT
ncbi:DUF350 domain-containing protein [Gracilibacillus oryzae]|uniref:DUF350 domain-containing protein n=1 Tax=Gracilibacillus oryzae TaxID=1672701 RepID=A0A7C8KVW1_9BACI|nr:DUF350 domain-containing protein [Gracilibacillus oryzae]KAB8137748.1 DUF350 domain-containing protein [Gracilibacillus oryzae]